MIDLGKLKEIKDLRKVWPHEVIDFTHWLAEEDDFQKYFTYTLIEYFGLSYGPAKILEREQCWKKCLDTIKNRYNDN